MRIKMRRIAGLMAVTLAIGFSAPWRAANGQTAPSPQALASKSPQRSEKAIRAVLATQQAAWNRGDIPAFLEGYWNSPELTFSGSDGIVRGYEGLLERYRKNYPDAAAMGKLDFSDLEVRVLGADSALVLGRWHLKRASGDIGGVFTLVFCRFIAGWRIIHDHTSAQKNTP